MSKAGRTLVALGAAAIALVIAAWFDNTVISDAQEQAKTDFSPLATMTLLEGLLVAGSVLLLGMLAWRSTSAVVGLAYVVVGGFFAAQTWLWWNVASARSDVLPEALALALRNLFYFSTGGSLNDVGTIAAGMLIVGVAMLARWWRDRVVGGSRARVKDPRAEPTLP